VGRRFANDAMTPFLTLLKFLKGISVRTRLKPEIGRHGVIGSAALRPVSRPKPDFAGWLRDDARLDGRTTTAQPWFVRHSERMNKRKIFAGLVILLLVAVAGVIFLYGGREGPLQVTGVLPPKDIVEIKRLVRRKIWNGVVPGFSWGAIQIVS